MALINIPENCMEPLNKLIDALSHGAGILYEPTRMKRLAKAKAQEANLIANTIRDNPDIPMEYHDGQIVIGAIDSDDIVKRTQNRLMAQELRKQNNIEAVTSKTIGLLESEKPVPDEPVDPDWVVRFLNSVEDVSNEQMQEIWARILAGEVKKPGTFSLRTLECIHNLTQKEAEAFQELCKHCLYKEDACFVLHNSDYQEKHGIPFGLILKLSECGLVNSGSLLSYNISLPKGRNYLAMTDDFILITDTESDVEKKSVSVYPLTESGTELAKVVGCHMDVNELKEVARVIKQETKIDNVKGYHITNSDDNSVGFDMRFDLLVEAINE